MAEAETSGAILARTGELMRANAALVLLAIVGLAIVDTLLESAAVRQSFALTGIMSLIAQYGLSVAALRKLGLVGDDERGARILPMFGLLTLTGLATVLGLLLLIVPGVILAVRWLIVVPILLAEQATVGAAMRHSWERTSDCFWPIFGVLAIYVAAIIVASAVSVLAFDGNRPGTFAMNIIIDTAAVAVWYVAIAVYENKRPAPNELEAVFA